MDVEVGEGVRGSNPCISLGQFVPRLGPSKGRKAGSYVRASMQLSYTMQVVTYAYRPACLYLADPSLEGVLHSLAYFAYSTSTTPEKARVQDLGSTFATRSGVCRGSKPLPALSLHRCRYVH